MRILTVFLIVAAFFLGGCSMAQHPVAAARTWHASSDGSISGGVRSALDGDPNVVTTQEWIGAYFPLGGGWAIKGGLLGPSDITFPWYPFGPPPAQAKATASPCMTTQTRMVPRTVMVEETYQVPMLPTPEPPRAANPCQPPPVSSLPDGEIDCPDGACKIPVSTASVR